MDLKIRQATLKDKNILMSFKLAFEEENSAYDGGRVTDKSQKRLKEDLIGDIKKQKIWVAEVDKKVIGLIKGEIIDILPDVLYVDSLFVDVPFRHQGIATELIKFIEDLFKKKGARKSQLFVAKQNLNAEKLYKKLGFKRQKEVWKKYQKDL